MNKKLNEVARIESQRVEKAILEALEKSLRDNTNVVNYDATFSESSKIARRVLKITKENFPSEEDSRYEEYFALSDAIFQRAFRNILRKASN